MTPFPSIESHLRHARDHARKGEYTAALVYFDGVLKTISRQAWTKAIKSPFYEIAGLREILEYLWRSQEDSQMHIGCAYHCHFPSQTISTLYGNGKGSDRQYIWLQAAWERTPPLSRSAADRESKVVHDSLGMGMSCSWCLSLVQSPGSNQTWSCGNGEVEVLPESAWRREQCYQGEGYSPRQRIAQQSQQCPAGEPAS